jgi:hypothetical protein
MIQGSFFSGQVPQGGSKPTSALHINNANSELIVRGSYFTGISDGGVVVKNDKRGSVLIEDNKMDFTNPLEADKFTGVTARGNTSTAGVLAPTARLSQRLASSGRTALSASNLPLSPTWGSAASVTGVSGAAAISPCTTVTRPERQSLRP